MVFYEFSRNLLIISDISAYFAQAEFNLKRTNLSFIEKRCVLCRGLREEEKKKITQSLLPLSTMFFRSKNTSEKSIRSRRNTWSDRANEKNGRKKTTAENFVSVSTCYFSNAKKIQMKKYGFTQKKVHRLTQRSRIRRKTRERLIVFL